MYEISTKGQTRAARKNVLILLLNLDFDKK